MSVAEFNYEILQKSLVDKGWSGSVDELKQLLQTTENNHMVESFKKEIKNIIYDMPKSIYDACLYKKRPLLVEFDSESKLALLDSINEKIDTYFKDCLVADYLNHDGVTLYMSNEILHVSFDIHWSDTLTITVNKNGKLKHKEEIKLS